MADAERILVARIPNAAAWRRLLTAFEEFDVESGDGPEYVWDTRRKDAVEESEVIYWGREGWQEGFWHARVYVEDTGTALLVMAERGDLLTAMNIVASGQKVRDFIKPILEML